MTTLDNLYYSNIAPLEYEVMRGSEYDITAKLVIRHEQQNLTCEISPCVTQTNSSQSYPKL